MIGVFHHHPGHLFGEDVADASGHHLLSKAIHRPSTSLAPMRRVAPSLEGFSSSIGVSAFRRRRSMLTELKRNPTHCCGSLRWAFIEA